MHPEAPRSTLTHPEVAEESPPRHLDGAVARVASALSIGLSLYALYWVLFIVQPQVYRVSFLLVSLVVSFLLFPRVRGARAGVSGFDWLLIAASIVALSWPLVDFGAFIYRALGFQVGSAAYNIPLTTGMASPVDPVNNSSALMSYFGLV